MCSTCLRQGFGKWPPLVWGLIQELHRILLQASSEQREAKEQKNSDRKLAGGVAAGLAWAPTMRDAANEHFQVFVVNFQNSLFGGLLFVPPNF